MSAGDKITFTLTESQVDILHVVLDASVQSGIDPIERAAALLHHALFSDGGQLNAQSRAKRPKLESMEIRALYSQHFNRR